MNFFKTLFSVLILLLISSALAACSGSSKKSLSPVDPGMQDDTPQVSSDGNRDILAVYDAVIDPVAQTFTITPDERISQYHFPLTQLYPNVLQITNFSFSPNLWADIKLRHPFPGSGIDAFDPRVIAILPANPGVRFVYPIFNCTGNNRVLLEPDGYTKLFDNLGGSIPGNTNPFKAYFKDQPNRLWSSSGTTEETQRWQMDISGFGGPLQFKLVVDISTNYPNPPYPGFDNAPEPVQIDTFIERDLTIHGGSSLIEVTLLDWQGASDIKCKLESPDLFAGAIQLFYSRHGYNANEYIFSGTISNSLLSPEGKYKILVAAWDVPANIHMFQETTAVVSGYIPTDGELYWARRAGGSTTDGGRAITTLYGNSIIVTGRFGGSSIFGKGEANETTLISSGNEEMFIAKYNQDGTLEWAKSAGGSGLDYTNGITTLPNNSIGVNGRFSNTATFGLGELNQTVLTSTGNTDIFIANYNSDGTLAWVKQAGSSNADNGDFGTGITSLSDNSLVVSGSFYGSITFGQGEINETTLTSTGDYDPFIARYNTDGSLAWARRSGSSLQDNGQELSTYSDDSIAQVGHFSGAATFGKGEPHQQVLYSAGGMDIFIARYNPDGSVMWAKHAGGSDEDLGWGITVLHDDSSYISGGFHGDATFGWGEPNEQTLRTEGEQDIFIARYNPDGTYYWAKHAGSDHNDCSWGLTLLSDDSITITGYYYDIAHFNAGYSNHVDLQSYGGFDIFLANYDQDGNFMWAKRAGGEGDDLGLKLTSLSDDSIVMTGSFNGIANFGTGEINQTELNSAGDLDICVARFAP